MYHRRKRSRQRSLSPALRFCGDAAPSFSMHDASLLMGVGTEDVRETRPEKSSSEKFLFSSSAVADGTCSNLNSEEGVAGAQMPCLSLSYVSGDVSPDTSYESDTVSSTLWRNSVVRKRCHSLSSVHEDLQLFPQDIDSVEGSFKNHGTVSSFKKEHLLNCLTGSALFVQGDGTKYSLMKTNSCEKLIARWDVFPEISLDNDKALIKEHGTEVISMQNHVTVNLSHNATHKQELLDTGLLAEIPITKQACETVQTPSKPTRKHTSYDELANSICKNDVRPSKKSNAKKHKTKIEDLEADESGVLKKKFEVEEIIDHCTSKYKRYYYVKWKGWSHCYNTWEPEEHLKTCKSVIISYIEFLRQRVLSGNLYSTQEAKDLQEKLITISKPDLEKLTKLYAKCTNVPYTVCSEEEIVHKMTTLLKTLKIRKGVKTFEKVRNDILNRAYDIHRMVQVDALQRWEEDLNNKATEKAKIIVENNVDLEGPPSNFTYVNDYIPGKGVVIPDDPPIGCACGPKCDKYAKECCGRQSGSVFAYSHKRLLVVEIGVPIYECNKRCKCNQNCSNRVVQKGRKIDLSIFRTSTGCGWGVKTLQQIKKGSFICEYVGEVIKTKEAERRGKIYDAEGRTYLFDLDFNVDACPYTVDAAIYGNVSHFINHSCNPNVAVYAVWVNCLDPNLPKLALFAKNDINIGEELTFDYMHNNLSIQNDKDNNTDKVNASPRSRLILPNAGGSPDLMAYKTPCRCGAPQCKRYLF